MLQVYFFRKERMQKMENLNLVTLPHFVSVKDLQKDEVESLIKRAEYFKQGGATPRLTKPGSWRPCWATYDCDDLVSEYQFLL